MAKVNKKQMTDGHSVPSCAAINDVLYLFQCHAFSFWVHPRDCFHITNRNVPYSCDYLLDLKWVQPQLFASTRTQNCWNGNYHWAKMKIHSLENVRTFIGNRIDFIFHCKKIQIYIMEMSSMLVGIWFFQNSFIR